MRAVQRNDLRGQDSRLRPPAGGGCVDDAAVGHGRRDPLPDAVAERYGDGAGAVVEGQGGALDVDEPGGRHHRGRATGRGQLVRPGRAVVRRCDRRQLAGGEELRQAP